VELLKSFPTTGLDRPLGFQEVEAPEFLYNRHVKVVWLSALRIGRLYPQESFLVLISIRGWVDPTVTVRPGRMKSLKNSTDSIGNRTRDLPPCSTVSGLLSMQHKAIQLLACYIRTSCWKRESENVEGSLLTWLNSEEIHIEILGLEMMPWQPGMKKGVKYINEICNICDITAVHSYRPILRF
jgi:hypothetical protein